MSTVSNISAINNTLNCAGCGALLHFAPGTNNLKCDYCGESNAITTTGDSHAIEAIDYDDFVESIDSEKQNKDVKTVLCKSCGSQTVFDSFVTSDKCSFCTAPLVLDLEGGKQYVTPHYVLPFAVTQPQAVSFFQQWVKGLWWSPNDLAKKVSGNTSILNGVYIPHWAYDTDTVTDYVGERGDYYYTTETYTETVDGKSETRTREVRHTSWSSASGTVDCGFRDLIVPASKSLPGKTLYKLEPWAFNMLVKFDERYMSGFRSETYQINPQDGLNLAIAQTVEKINAEIRNDIGGDEQRIGNTDTEYNNKAIKYLMLPVWISAYNYNNKIYQFTINASTGEVIGERPLSVWKIVFAVVAVLILIAVIVLYAQNR
ncbi:zinc finger domain-containing protein [Mucilaginibacter sp. UYCu711]|uniref:zinc finger domain-containing protein n=1 Tax=Mucilaginibacter sp. UYCu711 TaxID=3156339 RepID=UPI003D1E7A37